MTAYQSYVLLFYDLFTSGEYPWSDIYRKSFYQHNILTNILLNAVVPFGCNYLLSNVLHVIVPSLMSYVRCS